MIELDNNTAKRDLTQSEYDSLLLMLGFKDDEINAAKFCGFPVSVKRPALACKLRDLGCSVTSPEDFENLPDLMFDLMTFLEDTPYKNCSAKDLATLIGKEQDFRKLCDKHGISVIDFPDIKGFVYADNYSQMISRLSSDESRANEEVSREEIEKLFDRRTPQVLYLSGGAQ